MKEAPLCKLCTLLALLALFALLKLLTQCNICQHTLITIWLEHFKILHIMSFGNLIFWDGQCSLLSA